MFTWSASMSAIIATAASKHFAASSDGVVKGRPSERQAEEER